MRVQKFKKRTKRAAIDTTVSLWEASGLRLTLESSDSRINVSFNSSDRRIIHTIIIVVNRVSRELSDISKL